MDSTASSDRQAAAADQAAPDASTFERHAGTALYIQVQRHLAEQIQAGRLLPGEALPSEPRLAELYSVSRSTVRQALAELARRHLVRREPGVGSFVTRPPHHERFVQHSEGMFRELQRQGVHLQTRVLTQRVVSPPDEVVDSIGDGAAVHLRRLRMVHDRPLTVVDSYLPHDLCAGLEHMDLEDVSLYDRLNEDYGLVVGGGRRTVEAVAATQEIGELLGVTAGTPLLLVLSMGHDQHGRPLEWFRAWYRSDRIVFELEIEREGSTAGASTLRDLGPPRDLDAATGSAPPRASPVSAAAAALLDRPVFIEVPTPDADSAPHLGSCLRDAGVTAVALSGAPPSLDLVEELRAGDQPRVGLGGPIGGPRAPMGGLGGLDFVLTEPDASDEVQSSPHGRVTRISAAWTPGEIQACVDAGHPVVLVDPRLHGGVAMLRRLRALVPDAQIIAISDADPQSAEDLISAGAAGIWLSTSDFDKREADTKEGERSCRPEPDWDAVSAVVARVAGRGSSRSKAGEGPRRGRESNAP